jgi:hypothetical protein
MLAQHAISADFFFFFLLSLVISETVIKQTENFVCDTECVTHSPLNKSKVLPTTGYESPEGGGGGIALLFL